jgi:hypothetical protein
MYRDSFCCSAFKLKDWLDYNWLSFGFKGPKGFNFNQKGKALSILTINHWKVPSLFTSKLIATHFIKIIPLSL